MGSRALSQLYSFLERAFPAHLEECHLVDCKLGPLLAGNLVQRLARDCKLRKLSLVKTELNDTNTDHLKLIVRDAPFLIHLDISWNELSQRAMARLIETIAENRRLRYVNLSWN